MLIDWKKRNWTRDCNSVDGRYHIVEHDPFTFLIRYGSKSSGMAGILKEAKWIAEQHEESLIQEAYK